MSKTVEERETIEVDDVGQKLDELVDEDVKEKVEEELEEVETYSASANYWPG